MEDRVTVSDAIVSELERARVDTLFGIISIHNIPIYDALARHGGFRVIKPRGESGAVNMADAFGRIGDRLGVAITSTGTGAGNAAGSMIEAATAGTPLLHLTGQVASEYLESGRGYIHECRDQLAMLKSIGKAAYRVRQPQQAPGVVRRAILEALEPPTGPVSVEIPIDFQAALIARAEIITPVSVPLSADPDFLEELAERILAADRPVMWAGSGVIQGHASDEFEKLARLVDAAVLTSHGGRGAFPEHDERCIGYFATDPRVREFLTDADLLLSVGVRFRGNETGTWSVKLPGEHIGIDADPAAANRNYPHTAFVNGWAKPVLGELGALVARKGADRKQEYVVEVAAVAAAARRAMRESLGPYEAILDAIRDVLPAGGVVVRDVTVPSTTWGSRMIEVTGPRQTVHPATVGIGQGLPMAIGAQLASDRTPVLLMSGDGGFLVNIGELATAREEDLPLTAIVFDDGGYGVLRNLQNVVFEGRGIGVDLQSPDFVGVARSFGFESVRVGDGSSFKESLGNAIASDDPWVIVVDCNQLGSTPKPFSGTPSLDLYRPH